MLNVIIIGAADLHVYGSDNAVEVKVKPNKKVCYPHVNFGDLVEGERIYDDEKLFIRHTFINDPYQFDRNIYLAYRIPSNRVTIMRFINFGDQKGQIMKVWAFKDTSVKGATHSVVKVHIKKKEEVRMFFEVYVKR